jgi:hypothetical protein
MTLLLKSKFTITRFTSKLLDRATKVFLLFILLSFSPHSTLLIFAQPYDSIDLKLEQYGCYMGVLVNGWGDIDLDGDFDIVMTGKGRGYPQHLSGNILINGTDTLITKYLPSLFNGDEIHYGTIVFQDFDNDNRPEIFIAGTYYFDMWNNNIPHSIAKIYKLTNTGGIVLWSRDIAGDFTTFAGCADFDRDGDIDFHLNGAIYENKGGGQFVRNYKSKSDYE